MQLLDGNVQRFRGRLVFKAHRLCASLNSRLGSNTEEAKRPDRGQLGHPNRYVPDMYRGTLLMRKYSLNLPSFFTENSLEGRLLGSHD